MQADTVLSSFQMGYICKRHQGMDLYSPGMADPTIPLSIEGWKCCANIAVFTPVEDENGNTFKVSQKISTCANYDVTWHKLVFSFKSTSVEVFLQSGIVQCASTM